MVCSRRRTAAAPVAAKVRADDRKVAREQRRDLPPHQVVLRKTVQQQEPVAPILMSAQKIVA
jgi:hypothetical protein